MPEQQNMTNVRLSWREVGQEALQHAREVLSDKYLLAAAAIYAVADYMDTRSLADVAWRTPLIFLGAFLLRPGPRQRAAEDLTPD